MPEIVADCPRCRSRKITFDLLASTLVGVRHRWAQVHEAFCVCRHCDKSTVLILCDRQTSTKAALEKCPLSSQPGSVLHLVEVGGYVSIACHAAVEPPEHLPPPILQAFNEGAQCLAIDAFNAAATMFRLCLDLSTKALLPAEPDPSVPESVRRWLGKRLPFLFDKGILPSTLRDLSGCIKDNGNDGAHEGTVTREDAEDLLDFTVSLLDRVHSEPAKVQMAKERRDARRSSTA